MAELTPFAIWALSGGRFPLALGVLQILALDIGTDTLSAAALGAEPASPHVMNRPPTSGRLLSRTVAIRAFGILGPTEALFEMAAFVLAMVIAGWTLGGEFPTGPALAAASGAAFLTVVVAQSANTFACRSSQRPAWKLGWFSNRFLVLDVLVGFAFAVALVVVPAAADLLDQQWPPAGAWVVILAAAPAVIVVDAAWKRWTRVRPEPGAPAGAEPAGSADQPASTQVS